ncbi:MAG: UDP-N-acetylmuramoyl-tripeptide--D-alanyl-D-alanine ligase [Firmicutes bacterium]|nr:UDP-N-acetylmuramoyl-tripeptide--D-alanyl-D-alanine ligase [Bacillota bacterium]
MKLTAQEILNATGGTLLRGDINTLITSISTDTRTIEKNSLFVPIKGANFDGHSFLNQATESGATLLLSQEDTEANATVIKVEDTTKALGDIARYYREKTGVKVVGITGSVGKTTTKDMVANVLSQKYNTLKTEGNFNNHIGVPLTLFRLEEDTEVAVIEMGMNHFGEISYLTNIALPDMAIISNVGVSHIENLGSREGILKAKCEIFQPMDKGVKILNGDDDMLITLKGKYENIEYFSLEDTNCAIYAKNIVQKGVEGTFATLCFPDECIDVFVPLPGIHNVSNALSAALAGKNLGLSLEEIKKGIETFKPTKMRMDVINTEKYTLINDVYNANPVSVKAALDVLSGGEGEKCAILGDMFELGDMAAQLHFEVGEYAAKKADTLIAIGELSENIYKGAKECKNTYYFKTIEDFAKEYKNILKEKSVILIKASRGMHFEKITDMLKGE